MSTIEVPARTAKPGEAARGRAVLWLALLGAYVTSFFLPAYFDLPAESNPYPGDATVIRGWGAFLQGLLSLVLVIAGFIDSLLSGWSGDDRTYWLEVAALSWLANPAFWIGLRALRRRRWRTAVVTGLAALVLALLPPVPLPSKWHTQFLPPVLLERDYPPEAADDEATVRAISQRIRAQMEEALAWMVRRRRSIFFGSIFEGQLT
jgi:hypothetical protein